MNDEIERVVGYDIDENYETITTAYKVDGHIFIDGFMQMPVSVVAEREND